MKYHSLKLIYILIFLLSKESVCCSDSTIIVNSFNKLKTDSTNCDFQNKYFDVFPDNFKQFKLIFDVGMDMNEKSNLSSFEFINQFFNLNCISEEIFYNKMILISNNGTWDADAISHFQYGIKKKVKENVKLTYKVLKNNYKNETIVNFWRFFFDGLVPSKNYIDELEEIRKIDIKMYNTILDILKEKVSEWKYD